MFFGNNNIYKKLTLQESIVDSKLKRIVQKHQQ